MCFLNKELTYTLISENLKQAKVLIDEPMKKHTSFKIGGPVDILVIPDNVDEIIQSVKLCRDQQLDFKIIGNGSNLLVKDKGIRGIIIKIADNLKKIAVKEDKMIVEAGALLSTVSKFALRNSLSGFEFAGGIPGTIGGAVTMNAGAYGGEMKDVVERVKCVNQSGDVIYLTNEQMNFSYRNSTVEQENLIVLEVELRLQSEPYEQIKSKMHELNQKRITKQPLNLPSGGSTFKRPVGYYAAKLIEDAGLKGKKHGNAQVSEKHAGFIVNLGQASCEDVLGLVEIVMSTVHDKFGIELETEVKIIGED